MTIIYLRATGRAQLVTILQECGMWSDDQFGSRFKAADLGDALDEIGCIHKPTGNAVDVGDGITCPETAPIAGWHANLMLHGEIPAALTEITIAEPERPVRVFAT